MMRRRFALAWLAVACAGTIAAQAPSPAQQTAPQSRWWRGNTHTHTINSDGDSSPEAVVRWYKEHRYNFVVISDHDSLTPVEGLNALHAAPGKFVVLGGVEVTDRFDGAPVHLIGIGVRAAVTPQGGATIPEMLNRNARAIRAAGGVPHVNHPNFGWALTAEHVAAAADASHFELYNGHPLVNNAGGGGAPSTEEIWDRVLSTGRVLYGVATDDSHHFQGEFTASRVNPGRAWIMVRAAELSAETLLAAIARGDFYATTGVELKSYEADAAGIRIELPAGSGSTAPRYRTFFIGKDGAVLKRDESVTPSYQFTGGELYVRARIESSNGAVAWTQPVFRKK